jgi:hypothetical protein
MKPEWEFLTQTLFDPAVFWTMATAVATIVLVFVAYWQLRSLARTSRSDFLYRLKNDFFNDEARRLTFLAEQGLLKFHSEDDIPYFEILRRDDPDVAERMKELGIKGSSVSVYMVDDKLLGPMEDIGVLEKLRQVSLEEVYEVFVSYLNICIESPGLKEYLDWSRKDPEDDDVYDNLLYLYKKLKEETPQIRQKKTLDRVIP